VTFPIRTTIEHVALGMVIQFDNGRIGQRITVEEYDALTGAQDERVEFDGEIPFRDLRTGEPFPVPSDNPADLVPPVPDAFHEAFDD
jgi:hypothetical protein